jgi:serine protease AprX
MTDRRVLVALALACLMLPATGSIAPMAIEPVHIGEGQLLLPGQVRDVPHGVEGPSLMAQAPWWTRTTLDLDRNGIHDALEAQVGPVWVGLSYGTSVAPSHLEALADLGLEPVTVVPAVDALLLGQVDASLLTVLSSLDDVVMVEAYGQLVFWGDVQTPAVKARSSSVYPDGAWDLGVSGDGIVIAMVDTGVDDEHPGLDGKFVAGYDAVCYLHSDPECVLAGGRVTDGSFNPDDGNQHGTACMGMASATGLDASGAQTNFTGSAPDAALVDVRIGTDAGAGPFENYLLSQEFYESAMNGLQWIIDHKDDAWAGADEDDHGIDIISLSWGITSHEGGGSDGEDMHSRILNEAMEAGIVVSVAAGNDGPSNDGLSGMGSSSLSITVGATDDKNTIDRTDDTVAGYSSRGPRRDNGDGNPLDELKPEVSAPGTNIVQAEGCITQGGCNNFLGGDASENGYTNRGSGTSYATPSVSGIIALMLEANPELSTAEVKEILKFTAERRGEPSAPDVDPFWNRDFGWGIVDARAAVEMAIDLAEQGSTGLIDVSAQAHLLNISSSNGIVTLTGVAWAQGAPLLAVEYRVDDGAWRSATFDAVPGDLSSLERFNWTVALATDAFGEGGHEVEVRAVTQNGLSLSSFATFSGTVSEQGESGLSHLAVMILILAMVLTGTAAVRGASERPFILTEADVEREPLDATLVEDVGGEDESAGPPPS